MSSLTKDYFYIFIKWSITEKYKRNIPRQGHDGFTVLNFFCSNPMICYDKLTTGKKLKVDFWKTKSNMFFITKSINV